MHFKSNSENRKKYFSCIRNTSFCLSQEKYSQKICVSGKTNEDNTGGVSEFGTQGGDVIPVCVWQSEVEEEEKKNSYLNGVKHPRASLYFPFNVQFTLKSCELTVFHYSHLQHTKILHPYHNYDRSIPTFASGMRLLLPSPDHQMYTMATSPPGGSQIFLWHLVRVRFNIRTALKQN